MAPSVFVLVLILAAGAAAAPVSPRCDLAAEISASCPAGKPAVPTSPCCMAVVPAVDRLGNNCSCLNVTMVDLYRSCGGRSADVINCSDHTANFVHRLATTNTPLVGAQLKKLPGSCNPQLLAVTIVTECTVNPTLTCCMPVVTVVNLRGCLHAVEMDSTIIDDSGEGMTNRQIIMRLYAACGGIRHLPDSSVQEEQETGELGNTCKKNAWLTGCETVQGVEILVAVAGIIIYYLNYYKLCGRFNEPAGGAEINDV